jgi:hypothetical protein
MCPIKPSACLLGFLYEVEMTTLMMTGAWGSVVVKALRY